MSKTQRATLGEFKGHLLETRRHTAAAKAFAEAGDVTRAYAEAEAAQHSAFDAKDTISRVITWTLAATNEAKTA